MIGAGEVETGGGTGMAVVMTAVVGWVVTVVTMRVEVRVTGEVITEEPVV